ncbi:YbaB/EbfC family nucleoid-associated protein [Rhodothermus marinus]|jgi:DNA-binding YbaB/EbfC family protein|uniref:YbaB/EbfC family nucleoid-associated protein n=1 Tax=Rhodothermus marinus TaxID=29549 RepID=UPI001D246888|nr:YbaB/EbfC family nucleoid-associated protein [Rhodothermus marinus]MBO2491902.1 YbaB/EbfC family nucleoid-associated protein [Rhodothermus marinus]
MDGALNLGEVFGKVMELQQRLAETQQALGNRTVTVETGGGIVRVTANGLQRIVRIEVDPDAFRSEDQDMLEDLIVAGVNKALEEAARMAREEMQKAAGTLLPPGLDIDLSALGL